MKIRFVVFEISVIFDNGRLFFIYFGNILKPKNWNFTKNINFIFFKKKINVFKKLMFLNRMKK